LRCLIVDDNEQFLASASRLLVSQGLEVVGTVSTGTDAARLATELRPDVALVDVQLGVENGLDVARRLAAAAPEMPVILISTHPAEELADLTADASAAGFLPKTALSADAILKLLNRGVTSARQGK
jgi:DNA-binding NarL/FixJ family response regulator